MSDPAKIPPAETRSAIDAARRRERSYIKVPVALRVIGGLLLLIPIGTALLMLPWAGAKGPLTLQQALFTSVSALCVTGLSVITPALDLTRFGQLILLIEIQTGGVGFMLLVIAVLRVMRRRITLVDRLAVRDSLGLPEREQFAPILGRVLITVFAIEGISALMLWLNWRHQLDDVSALWYAIFHAISAFCNAGFDLFAGLPQFPTGLPRDPITLIILGTTIVLGGLGFPVLAELIHWRPRRRLSLHARLTLGISMALFAGGALGFLIGEIGTRNANPDMSAPERALYALFQSASTRTAGFALDDLSTLTPSTQFLMIAADVHRHRAGIHGRRHHDGHFSGAAAFRVGFCARLCPAADQRKSPISRTASPSRRGPHRVHCSSCNGDLAAAADQRRHDAGDVVRDCLGFRNDGVVAIGHAQVEPGWPDHCHGHDDLGTAGGADHHPRPGAPPAARSAPIPRRVGIDRLIANISPITHTSFMTHMGTPACSGFVVT